MTKQFIIFVIDDQSGLATANEIETIDAFNDELRANGQDDPEGDRIFLGNASL